MRESHFCLLILSSLANGYVMEKPIRESHFCLLILSSLASSYVMRNLHNNHKPSARHCSQERIGNEEKGQCGA